MRQRQFRTKTSFADDEDEPAPVVVKPSKTEKKKDKSKVSLLSFGDDDDIQAPSHKDRKKDKDRDKDKDRSKPKLKVQKQPIAAAGSGPSSTQVSAAGEYTAERLKQLQKNAVAFSSTSLAQSAAPSQPVIKLSGSFKPAGAPKDDRFSILAAPSSKAIKEEDDNVPSRLPPSGCRPSSSGGVSDNKKKTITVVPSDEEEDDGPSLPTDEMIRVAKAKRERLRQAHLAPDYIPLGGAAKLTSSDFKAAESAPHSGSDEELEDNMRMKFMGAAAGKSRVDRRHYALSTGETEEEEEFAAAQLKKAIRHNSGQDLAGGRRGETTTSGGSRAQGPGSATGTAGGARIGSRVDIIRTKGEAAINNLQQAVERLTASYRQAGRNRDRTAVNLNGALANMDIVQAELKAAGEKYVGLQEVRDWVADLCNCLQHKSVIIEELEDHLLEYMEDRSIAEKELESAVARELHQVAEAGVLAAAAVMSRGGALAAAAAAAHSAMAEEEERVVSQAGAGAGEVDEFGRSLNYGKQREAEERAEVRKQHLAKAVEAMKGMSSGKSLEVDAGGGTVVEDEVEVKRYESRRSEVVSLAGTAFADAAENFATLHNVKSFLEQRFKQRYPKEYQSAYMSLSVPALLAPYVRLELLTWDPMFEPRYRSFDKQRWYDELFSYGVGNGVAAVDGDADFVLVPTLVSKVVLPRALHMVARCWSVHRWQQSSAVANILADLLVYIPADDEKMRELVSLIKGTLTDAVTASKLPAWPTSATAACTMALQVLHVKFCNAVRLLRSISAFEGLLARSFLLDLAFGQLVCGSVVMYMRSSAGDVSAAVARCEAVAGALHSNWFKEGLPKEAAGLGEHVVELGQSLEVQTSQSVLKNKMTLLKRLGEVRTRLGMLR